MVMRFFKKNEKVIMVTLLALIAPTFAFTGLVYQFAASRNSALYEVFGQTLITDLKPGGEDIEVDDDNKHEYIALLVGMG